MNEIEISQVEFARNFEAAFARLQVRLEESCAGVETWSLGVAATIRAGFRCAAADPAAARLLTIEALARGPEGIARNERLVAYLRDRLLPGREESPDGEHLPEITERAMAGGVLALVAQRVDRGGEGELPALAPDAIQFVLTPYLGAGEAHRIATQFRPGHPRQG
jgi:hypothetical protein